MELNKENMSFLFEDEVLAKILIDSGVFGQLNKQAQQVHDSVKLVARKLAQNLMTQATSEHDRPDTELYVRDLVDLDAYLNFLLKNNQRYDGKLIVFHQAVPTDAKPPNPELYIPYKEFLVYKDGLMERIRELDIAANQAGNEVMKPFVKGLVEQMNGAFKTDYKRMPTEAPKNPSGQDDKGGDGKGKHKYQVGFSADESVMEGDDESGYINVKHDKSKGKGNAKSMQDDINALRDSLPFQSQNSLSPYNMYLFVSNISQILHKHPKLVSGPMLGQFEQFNYTMYQHYTNWQRFVSNVANAKASNGENVAPNAATMRDELPYDRGQRPNSMLQSLFGSDHFARQAAQQLIQMVNLTQQALLSITRSPQLVDLLGKDIVSNQTNQAKAYNDSLTPFARGSI